MPDPCTLLLYARDGTILFSFPGTCSDGRGQFERATAIGSGEYGSARLVIGGSAREVDMAWSPHWVTMGGIGTVWSCETAPNSERPAE